MDCSDTVLSPCPFCGEDASATVFVVVQETDSDYGGADVVAAYDDKEKANARIAVLEKRRDSGGVKYKYPVSWFIVELELNKHDRWA